ncbi:hypothetical protein [Bifidobacterium samirii]|uniref:Uncharacterized protein n=1 Tax=Bifidobacterium samirii TaxID=2306974 RepID=A0A430FJH4_9BIFI|nr:hypothetical protein [Bifidobacterium samirii]RSX53029.1 hypothetical protein D2E24_1700 [Bifidobacterium samirii]
MTVLAMGLNVVSRGWDNLDQEERIGALSVFLAYLLREYPRLERELDRKSGDKIKDIGRIIAEWCRQSDADPKS